jgi:hypothetical protein
MKFKDIAGSVLGTIDAISVAQTKGIQVESAEKVAGSGSSLNKVAVTSALLSATLAAAKVYGYDIDADQVITAASGLSALFGIISNMLHIASNSNAGK